MPEALLVVLGFALVVGFFATLVVGGWGFERARHAGPACCRRCRYPVAGLASGICPECGGTLDHFGTLLPGQRPIIRPPRFVARICRTLLLGIVVWPVIAAVAVDEQHEVSRARATATSASGLFSTISIEGAGSGYSAYFIASTPRPGTRAVVVARDRSATLIVTDPATRAKYSDGSGRWIRTPDAFTDADILLWMRSAGVNTDSPAALQEAHAVGVFIRNIAVGGGAMSEAAPRGELSGLRSVIVVEHRRHPLRLWAIMCTLAGAMLAWAHLMRQVRRWSWPRPVPSPATAADSAHSAPRSPS